MTRHLELEIAPADGDPERRRVPVRRLLLAGYAGRDPHAVLEHVRELERLGVPPPDRIPSVFDVDPRLVTLRELIEVSGPETSGEAEVLLLSTGDGWLVGVGSDHTDRAREAVDVPSSKRSCPKPVGRTVWRLDDVSAHWDRLELRSWTDDGTRRLYQEGTLAELLAVEQLLAELARTGHDDLSAAAVFGGTLPTLGGLSCGRRFETELHDPVLGRTTSCAYGVSVPVPERPTGTA